MKKMLQDSLDFAMMHGLLKYNLQDRLTHAPFTLTPYPLSKENHQQITKVTEDFQSLMMKVSSNVDFLKEHLEPLKESDGFVRMLLSIFPNELPQPFRVLISRNDFILHQERKDLLLPKQVEFNTISVSFPFLSSQVNQLHRYLFKEEQEIQIEGTNPLGKVAEGLAKASIKYDKTQNPVMLMVVQPGERNVFDQRAIEYLLEEKYQIPTLRMSLEEIFENGKLKEGHLQIHGQTIPLVYFRAGYTPDDYVSSLAIKGRELIEFSSAIKVPDLPMQLAGSKKIQQVLSAPENLQRFVSEEVSEKLRAYFVGLYALANSQEEYQCIEEKILQDPHRYILKPQREGGGSNLYDEEMLKKLKSMQPSERSAYIVMERINAPTHSSTLVVDSIAEENQCISEVGRYGVCFSEENQILLNEDAGYLVRTKQENENEGGVCAGYSCLDSIQIQ